MPSAIKQLYAISRRQSEDLERHLGRAPVPEATAVTNSPINSTATTVEDALPSTVEASSYSTVEGVSTTTVEGDDLWRAEGADGVFTSSRIVRIIEAQQAMTHVEEAVYDALWGQKKKGELELSRLCQMGYAELATKARVSKRTIQSVIDRLVDKHMIAIETQADIRRRKPTVYRVFSYAVIRKYQRDTGRNWVVRTGKGVFYATKILLPTVEVASSSTVVASSASTVAPRSPSTVAPSAPSTVEATSTQIQGNKNKGTSSSGTAAGPVQEALSYYALADDDAIRRLIVACKASDPDATDDEIVHFIHAKGQQFQNKPNVGNIIGLLITAVPRCFESAVLFQYRSAKQRERAQATEAARRVLDDPTSSRTDREWAENVLRGQPD